MLWSGLARPSRRWLSELDADAVGPSVRSESDAQLDALPSEAPARGHPPAQDSAAEQPAKTAPVRTAQPLLDAAASTQLLQETETSARRPPARQSSIVERVAESEARQDRDVAVEGGGTGRQVDDTVQDSGSAPGHSDESVQVPKVAPQERASQQSAAS